MKKILFLIAVIVSPVVFNTQKANAQVLLGLPYEKNKTESRKPMPYQYVREADVMWSKTIWRRLELREKMNQHLYFPTQPMDGRKSLIDLLLDGIHTQGLTAYNPTGNDEFSLIMTEKEVQERMGYRSEWTTIETLEGELKDTLIEKQVNSAEIKSYLLKELWFFDKQRSVMEVRIIGLCPIREYYKDDDIDMTTPQYTKTFWIFYPEARKILATNETFNPKNDAQRLSFDDVFQKRLFSSYIVQESNIYDNRLIEEYASGIEILLESERIKEEIFNFEQDLWEY